MEDTQLMLRVKDGDEDAFREIVLLYRESILNLCYRYVGNKDDAEEVAQDVFIRLYRAASTYEPKAKLSTYLYRIAVNLSLNRIRDRKWKRWVSWETQHNETEGLGMADIPGPHELLERKEKQQTIQSAIDTLPANQRTAVILKRYKGFSYEEIAEVMECTVSAVEARLHRAKQNLKKRLQDLIE